MPLYEFYCEPCNEHFDVRRTLSQGTEDVTCPLCTGDNVQRIFTPVALRSNGREGMSMIGGNACGGCTITNCSSCPSARRK
jgi:putative FmdB family regulatory protein